MQTSENTSGYRIIVQRESAPTIRTWRGKKGVAKDTVIKMMGYLDGPFRFTITDIADQAIIAHGTERGFEASTIGPLNWGDY